jgi:hypothetical protein
MFWELDIDPKSYLLASAAKKQLITFPFTQQLGVDGSILP